MVGRSQRLTPALKQARGYLAVHATKGRAARRPSREQGRIQADGVQLKNQLLRPRGTWMDRPQDALPDGESAEVEEPWCRQRSERTL